MTDRETPRPLTGKQRAFVNAYVGPACFNATEAAKLAGYSAGDRDQYAKIGWRNLQKPHILQAIEILVKENAMLAVEALSRYAEQARGSMGDFIALEPDGTARVNLNQAALLDRLHLIKAITLEKGEIKRLELYDAQKALETLLKALGVFSDGVTVQIDNVDLETWRKQAEQRLKDVLAMPDPYQEGVEQQGTTDVACKTT